MVNPQWETGYTKIANEIMDALARIRIPGEARQVLDAILRKTYGWNKKQDEISLSQFKIMTGLSSVHIVRARKKLLKMNIITVTQKGNEKALIYRFQKNYDRWKVLPKKVTLPKKVIGVTQKGNKPLPKKGNTKDKYKDNSTKDTKYRKKFADMDIKLNELLIKLILKNDPKSKVQRMPPTTQETWLIECRRLREIDKRTPEEIKFVIEWTQQDSFERTNVHSMPKLRKRFSQLFMKAKRDKGYDKFVTGGKW